MEKIILAAETGADIPPELTLRYNIQIVPMHVVFGDVTRDDGTFPSEEICAYYERTRELPKTSASTPEDFNTVFDRIHVQWPDAQILYLAYSAVTTCSYQSAQIAAKGRNYVTSLDTKMASAGQHAIVIRVAELLEQHPDWTVAEAAAAAQDLIGRTKMCFIPDQLEYLRAGGRVSNAAAMCGKLLSIHPLIEFQNGYLLAAKKLRGKFARLAPQLVRDYAERHSLELDEVWLIWKSRFSGGIAPAGGTVRPLLRVSENHLGQNWRRNYNPWRPRRFRCCWVFSLISYNSNKAKTIHKQSGSMIASQKRQEPDS